MSELDAEPEGILTSPHLGVRVWWIAAATLQEMVDRLATVLGEHLQDSDDLHVSYHGMQKGWQDKTKLRLLRAAEQWSELDFEYSTLVILATVRRPMSRSPTRQPGQARPRSRARCVAAPGRVAPRHTHTHTGPGK
jgi:hypothetical protein